MKNHDAQLNSSETIGAYLREKRMGRDIGLEEVSASTGISPAVLRALENEDREQLPAEVYIKAFYKKYAAYLDLDPEEIQAKYLQEAQGQKKTGRKFNSSTVITLKGQEENLFAQTFRRLLLPIAVLVSGILFYWIYKNYLAPYNPLGFYQEHLPNFYSYLLSNLPVFFS